MSFNFVKDVLVQTSKELTTLLAQMIKASSEFMPLAKLKSQGFILKSLIMVLFAGTNWAFTAGFSASQETRLIFKSAPFQRGKFAEK